MVALIVLLVCGEAVIALQVRPGVVQTLLP
jgi:hypothetical protein